MQKKNDNELNKWRLIWNLCTVIKSDAVENSLEFIQFEYAFLTL